jgi:hypothetical protein
MQKYAEAAVAKQWENTCSLNFSKRKRGEEELHSPSDLTLAQIDQIVFRAIRYSERGTKLFNQGKSMDSIYKEFKKNQSA